MLKLGVGPAVLAIAGVGLAQVTECVDVDANGAQGAGGGNLTSGASVSADGRYVLFISSSLLVPGDTNGAWDVFVRDRLAGTTEFASVDSNGTLGNGFSGLYGMWVSPDGRYVAFESRASNLVPGDTNGARDIFLRDRQNGTTERVSVATGAAQGNSDSLFPSISPDARYVAFTGKANNLVAGDTNGYSDVFVRDRMNGTTEMVSVATGGANGNSDSYVPVISADGRFVAFESLASNLIAGDTNGAWDVFVHDRFTSMIERVSVSTGGAQGNNFSYQASISGDGRYVGFTSAATNLVPGDTNGSWDVFVRDRQSGTTERVSVATGGGQLSSDSGGLISADGRFVTFSTGYVFVRDRLNGTTETVSVSTGGAQANGTSGVGSISADGRYVVFGSSATNLVPGDTNGHDDVFLHDRAAAGFTSMCEPGAGGVGRCPCSNPPLAPSRGCDNSFSTGGAGLSASGIAYLSIDSLIFTTSDQTPSATSIVLQGNALIPSGAVFGQGVRCAGGALKRLYLKQAVAGSITAPDLGAGDPTVSARSASLGDSIQAGQSRFYLVLYRDPVVSGGCPASSTFNATQTGQVTWWP